MSQTSFGQLFSNIYILAFKKKIYFILFYTRNGDSSLKRIFFYNNFGRYLVKCSSCDSIFY